MPISINPIFSGDCRSGCGAGCRAAARHRHRRAGDENSANDLVRIAIANLSIEVFSEIPLQVGQTLQLAVSQTAEGIKLAVVRARP